MSQMYTKEQLEIELIKQKNERTSQALLRLEDHTNQSLLRLEDHFYKLESRMDTHFHWTLGSILGLYGLSFTGLIAAICKAYGVV